MGLVVATKKTVDAWMADLAPALRDVAEALRQTVLRADPELTRPSSGATPCMRRRVRCATWRQPGPMVSLGFFNGAALSDPGNRIEGTGKKMRHIKVRSIADIETDLYAEWVRQAVSLKES